MLVCTETVTFIRCDGDGYALQTYSGVSWFAKTVVRLEGAGLVHADEVRIRIPASVLGADALPKVGDQVIHGAFDSVPTKQSEIAAHHPRRVLGVGDNRRGGIPHVAVTAG